MKTQPKIQFEHLWLLIIPTTIGNLLGAISKMQHWPFPQYLSLVFIGLFFLIGLIIYLDNQKHKLFSTFYLIAPMILFPYLFFIFYMIRRKKLIS